MVLFRPVGLEELRLVYEAGMRAFPPRLSEPPKRLGAARETLLPPTAEVVSVSLAMSVYQNEEFRDLTADEWNRVVFRADSIRLRSYYGADITLEFPAGDGETFTVAALAKAVEDTERETRGSSRWFGGVDVHHVFFEGIHVDDDGVWWIHCGS